MHSFFKVAIIGRPNVGKSTLFNRIVGHRQAVTSKEPGTTRDRVIADVDWWGKKFTLIDTAGVLFDFYGFENENIEKLSQHQVDEALCDANLILFVVSAKEALTSADKEIAKKIKKTGKEAILVCNKADSLKEEQSCDNFYQAGMEEVFPISASNGRRVGDLLNRIINRVPATTIKKDLVAKVAIIGRPNVGKSTIFNSFVGKDRSIVSDVAGTTRDSINERVAIGPKVFEIIDTAGLRRRGRREVGVEKFSVFRTIDAISSADLVLLLVDAEEGVTRGDAHLAQFALDKKKKIIIVINKIDRLKQCLTSEVENLYRFKFINKIKTVAVSAKTNVNIGLLKKEILKEI